MVMGCLYLLTSPSGKGYVGITRGTLEDRWAKHEEHALGKRDAGALYAALRKYGPTSFQKRELVRCDSWRELQALERGAITAYRTFAPSGYNLTEGGEGSHGPRSDAARLRISLAQKKRYQRKEQSEALRMYGARGHAKMREISASRRIEGLAPWKWRLKVRRESNASEQGRALIRAKISATTKAAMARPEVRVKVSASAKARAADPGWRRKISLNKKGKKRGPMSDETKAKITAARLREWTDPVLREKRLVALAKARKAKVAA